VCEELRLLKVSMLLLSRESSMNSHFTHTTSIECKPSLILSIVQGWCFTNGFLQNALRTQCVDNVLFNDEAGFTRDHTANFHNTHTWVDDNPHTAMASSHQYQFSIHVYVGTLGNNS
jgi:hypothetical protein